MPLARALNFRTEISAPNPRPRRKHLAWAMALMAAFLIPPLAAAAPKTAKGPLKGPSDFRPEEIGDSVFYVPVAQGSDKSLIESAKSKGAKINLDFYTKYHAPLVSAVKTFARRKGLGVRDQVNLFGWLVIQTHNANDIGYLWGGDLLDGPNSGGSTSGIGYDCSGFVWSVWEAISPGSAFANGGDRLASRNYLDFGRLVFPRGKVNEEFIQSLLKYARPGDVMIDPNGHITLFGYDPRSKDRRPIVMENGEFWNYTDKWLVRNRGKRYEVRSTFDEQGDLIPGRGGIAGRALPSMPTPEPLLVASAKTPKPEKGSATRKPPAPEPLPEEDVIGQQILELMGEMGAFQDMPDVKPDHVRSSHVPRIDDVRAPALRMWNDQLRFTLSTSDADGDSIVQYRIRSKGAREWVRSDRPYFQTSMPGYKGLVPLEFQIVDSSGAVSAIALRQVEVVPR